jgi:hypothetical protein
VEEVGGPVVRRQPCFLQGAVDFLGDERRGIVLDDTAVVAQQVEDWQVGAVLTVS